MSTNKEHAHHIIPLGTYISIATTLIVLTGITVYISFYDFGAFNLMVAMVIAATKASLVALYFMHLKYDNKIYSIILVGSLLFLAIFIILTMFDTLRRDDIYKIKGGPVNPDAIIYRQEAITDSLPLFLDSTTTDSSVVDTLSNH